MRSTPKAAPGVRRISASQISTFENCNRFWWIQRILRLSEPPAAHFTFGTVLHGVNERYLSATMNGRVPEAEWSMKSDGNGQLIYNSGPHDGVYVDRVGHELDGGPLEGQVHGQPVNLYPPGWKSVTERDGSTATITDVEAKEIQRLVAEAIESGILIREDGIEVERELLVPVIDGVELIGYIDVYRPDTPMRIYPMIEDHKSYGKGSLRYIKTDKESSPRYIGKDQQLVTYAWAISELDGWDGNVELRHNQFPKFPNKTVTEVEGFVTRAEIQEHGEYLRTVAADMVRTAATKDWADVPGPKDAGKCSRWYGKPCPFSGICGRVETADTYKLRLERLANGEGDVALPPLPLVKLQKGKSTMGVFDHVNKNKNKRAERKEAAGVTEAKAATPLNGAKPVAQESVENGAPWANPGCKACRGRGMTSKGGACPICDNTAKRAKKLTSMAYVIELDENNLALAYARAEQSDEVEAAGMPLEWIEAEGASPEPAPVEAPAPVQAVQEPAPAPAPVEGQVASPEPAPPVKTRKRRRTKAEMEAARAEEMLAAQALADSNEEAGVVIAKTVSENRELIPESVKVGRPKTSLTIMIGATYLTGQPGGREVVTSSEVLERFGAELAADMGSNSYWELDSFKRRDRLAQKAEHIATELGKTIMVHPGILGNDDVGTLLQHLMSVQGVTVISRTS